MAFEDWKKDLQSKGVPVGICYNQDLLVELNQLLEACEKLQVEREQKARFDKTMDELASDPREARLVEVFDQVEADREKHTHWFGKVPYDVWQAIIEKHPPTPEQRDAFARIGRVAEVNLDAATPDLVSASCREPEMTVGDVEWFRDHFPSSELGRLLDGALRANNSGALDPKYGTYDGDTVRKRVSALK